MAAECLQAKCAKGDYCDLLEKNKAICVLWHWNSWILRELRLETDDRALPTKGQVFCTNAQNKFMLGRFFLQIQLFFHYTFLKLRVYTVLQG